MFDEVRVFDLKDRGYKWYHGDEEAETLNDTLPGELSRERIRRLYQEGFHLRRGMIVVTGTEIEKILG